MMDRNQFMAALAYVIFVAHPLPKSTTKMFCHQEIAWGKPHFTLQSQVNTNLIELGAKREDQLVPNLCPK
jgi:hypothetical protein